MPARLRVTLRKSPISYTARARGTVRALGLHRIGDSHVLPDDPAVRGQVRAVRFLVEVEELAAGTPGAPAANEEETRP
ncbi:MAG: 50S ribosomal protein L30 [Chloroflexota bacterium]|nr:MAG: 50S ribosomal protein L30 [Chloroflexota bacterium]